MSKPDMWKCGACGAPNVSTRDTCYSCALSRKQDAGPDERPISSQAVPEQAVLEACEQTPSLTCPKCGSEQIARPNRLLKIAYILVIVAAVALLKIGSNLLGVKLMEGGQFVTFAPGQDYVE